MEKKLIAQIGGMHCGACSSRIEKVVGKLDGVLSAQVNLASETIDCSYLEGQINEHDIANRIEKIGFKLLLQKENKEGEIELKINGMHCASCSSRVERLVSSLAGVESASVNLATERGRFVYDTSHCSVRAIKEKIRELGFLVEDIQSPVDDRLKKVEDDNLRLQAMRQRVAKEFFFLIPLLYVSMGEMIGLPLPESLKPGINPLSFSLLQLVLTLPIIWFGRDFYLLGIPALIRKAPNMDSLIAIGTGAAFIYSLWNVAEISTGNASSLLAKDLYFESVGVLITLVSLGKYMETKSKYHTSDAIGKLMDLSPKTAELIIGDEQQTIAVQEIEVDDILLIRMGESIPTDGVIVHGQASLDESMMTGESMPVSKSIGEQVFGGTVNLSAPIKVRALKISKHTLLSSIIRMVEEAQGSKASIARIADRVSYYFVPGVISLAILTGAVWMSFTDVGFSQSLRFFIAVLVIACPCAMGLATPISIMVGTGRGAQLGILIRNGETLELLEKPDTIVFDKTGTVTRGKPEVVAIEVDDSGESFDVLRLLASAEQASEHPLAKAMVKSAQQKNLELRQPTGFISYPGQGIEAEVGAVHILLGSRDFLKEKAIPMHLFDERVSHHTNLARTVLFFALNKNKRGIVVLSDVVKDESAEAVSKLKQLGCEVLMLTGDNEKTGRAVANQIGIDHVIAGVMPDKKAEEIIHLQKNGNRIVMVGDGINDAPALAVADVGIAMGTGIDVAIESGDVVLMKENLNNVVAAIDLSAAVMRNIRQNLFWAFGYNILGIPLAAGVLYAFGGPSLNPMFAGAAMALSSVSVVFNALRLRKFTPHG